MLRLYKAVASNTPENNDHPSVLYDSALCFKSLTIKDTGVRNFYLETGHHRGITTDFIGVSVGFIRLRGQIDTY